MLFNTRNIERLCTSLFLHTWIACLFPHLPLFWIFFKMAVTSQPCIRVHDEQTSIGAFTRSVQFTMQKLHEIFVKTVSRNAHANGYQTIGWNRFLCLIANPLLSACHASYALVLKWKPDVWLPIHFQFPTFHSSVRGSKVKNLRLRARSNFSGFDKWFIRYGIFNLLLPRNIWRLAHVY